MKLSIINEMPLNIYKSTINRHLLSKMEKDSPIRFNNNSFNNYMSPRIIKVAIEKLNRLSNYNINVFVCPNDIPKDINELSLITNTDISNIKNSINFLFVGDNNQKEFSPWLLVHQMGEALAASRYIITPNIYK